MHCPLLLHGQTLTYIVMFNVADARHASVALKKNCVVLFAVTFQTRTLFRTSAPLGLPSDGDWLSFGIGHFNRQFKSFPVHHVVIG